MTKTTVKVDGMMCGMCESHVNDAVRKAFQVDKVSSSHSKGETVIISDGPLDEGTLKTAISATGYEVKESVPNPMRKRKDSFLSSINNKKVKGRRSGKESPAFVFQDKIYFFITEKTVVGGFVCNLLGQLSSKLEG